MRGELRVAASLGHEGRRRRRRRMNEREKRLNLIDRRVRRARAGPHGRLHAPPGLRTAQHRARRGAIWRRPVGAHRRATPPCAPVVYLHLASSIERNRVYHHHRRRRRRVPCEGGVKGAAFGRRLLSQHVPPELAKGRHLSRLGPPPHLPTCLANRHAALPSAPATLGARLSTLGAAPEPPGRDPALCCTKGARVLGKRMAPAREQPFLARRPRPRSGPPAAASRAALARVPQGPLPRRQPRPSCAAIEGDDGAVARRVSQLARGRRVCAVCSHGAFEHAQPGAF
jgi:hypothetical protein